LDSFWNPTDRNGNFKERNSLAETSFYADDEIYFPNPASPKFVENFTQISENEDQKNVSAQVSNIELAEQEVQVEEMIENDDKSAQVNLASLIEPYLKDSGNQTSRKERSKKNSENHNFVYFSNLPTSKISNLTLAGKVTNSLST